MPLRHRGTPPMATETLNALNLESRGTRAGHADAGRGDAEPGVTARRFRRASRYLALVCAGVGGAVLLGWLVGHAGLPLLFGTPAMMPGTALGLLLGAGALLIRVGPRQSRIPRWLSDLLSILLFGWSLLALSQYLFGYDLGIDRFPVEVVDSGNPHPGRSSPHTLVAFVLSSIALFFTGRAERCYLSSRTFALMVLFGAMSAIAGHLYGVASLYGVRSLGPNIGMAVHTSAGFVLLSLAIMFARPERGVMRLLSSETSGGSLARRMVGPLLVLPLLFGLLAYAGASANLFSPSFGMALALNATIFAMCALTLRYALRLDREEDRRRTAEEQLRNAEARYRTLYEALPDALLGVTPDGTIAMVNREAEREFGYSRGELIGQPIGILVPEDRRAQHQLHLKRYMERPTQRGMAESREIVARRRDGSEFPVQIALSPHAYRGECLITATIRNVTAVRESKAALAREVSYIRLLESIASVANESNEIEPALEATLSRVCQRAGWVVGHAFVRESNGDRLVSANGWFSTDPERFRSFKERTARASFAVGEGLIGAACASREILWSADLWSREDYLRRKEAVEVGLRSSVFVPIRVRDSAVAVLELYGCEVRPPDRHMMEVLTSVAAHLARLFERIQSEERVRQEEARLRTVIENLPAGVWLLDGSGKIQVGNRAGQRIWGGARFVSVERFDEYKGWWVDTGARIAANEWGAARAIQRGETSTNELLEIESFDGRRKVILHSAFPLFGKDGTTIEGAVVVNEEITDRYFAERRERFLASSAALLAESFDISSILRRIARHTTSMLADLCAIYVRFDQEEAISTVAHSRPELDRDAALLVDCDLQNDLGPFRLREVARTGRALFSFDPRESAHLFSSAMARCGLQAERIEITSYVAVPIKTAERNFGAALLATDGRASDRRLSESDLLLVEQLANRIAIAIENVHLYRVAMDAVRARDDILAIVSHDLRSPLNTIGLASHLLEQNAPNTEKELARRIATIRTATRRMERMVRDLLDASSIEAGALTVTLADTDLREIAEAIRDQFGLIAERKSVNLEVSSPAEPSPFQCDRDRILQGLSNLVENALKFTPSGGSVRVVLELSRREVLFSVSDSGPGIPEADRAHLFDRYWCAREMKGTGTGLGLFILKGVVDAHGGRIRVESAEGRGTIFFLSLPRVYSTDCECGDVAVPGGCRTV